MISQLWMKYPRAVANNVRPKIELGGRIVTCTLIQLVHVDFGPEIIEIVCPKSTTLIPGEGVDVGLLDAVQILDGRIRRIIILVVWIVPEPQVGIFQVWLLDAWLAEAVSCSQQAVDVNILNIASTIFAYGLLNRSIQCYTHQVEVLTQVCSHHIVLLAIRIWIRRSCKGHSIATGVLIIEKLAITSHIQPKAVSARALAVLDDLLDY